MLIEVLLVADDPRNGRTAVSTMIELDADGPRWPGLLVDAVATQAEAGARQLCDQLGAPAPAAVRRRLAEAPATAAALDFVPLAALVPKTRVEGAARAAARRSD